MKFKIIPPFLLCAVSFHAQAALVSYQFSGVVEEIKDPDGHLYDAGIESGLSRFSTRIVVDTSAQVTSGSEAKIMEPLLTKVTIAEKYSANVEGARLSFFNDAPTTLPLPVDGLEVSGSADLNFPGATDTLVAPEKSDSVFHVSLIDLDGDAFNSNNLPTDIQDVSSFENRNFSISSFWKNQLVVIGADENGYFDAIEDRWAPSVEISGRIEDVRSNVYSLPTAKPSKTTLQGSILDFNPNAPTVVITHGWQPMGFLVDPGKPNWVHEMAENILATAPRLSVNVIEAYWDDAHTALGTNDALERATAQTAMQGMSLAASLAKLPGDFSGGLHFVGHSLGAIVNAYAANTLAKSNIITNQFTILDRPFARGLRPDGVLTPNGIDSDQIIFRTLLPEQKVGYVDNYYGGEYEGFSPASGGPLSGYATAFDSSLPSADHPGVREFYNSTILRDDDYCKFTGGFGCSLLRGQIEDSLPKWNPRLTPTTMTKKAVDLNPVDWLYINCVLGSHASEAVCRESSPAYLWREDFVFDVDADFLAFDFYWGNGGDGDWLTLHFNDVLLFSFLGDSLEAGVWLNSGLIPIEYLAGQRGALIFSLNSIGDVNAEISVRNIEISSLGIEAVPEPGTLFLIAVAVFGLAHLRRCR